MDEPAARASSAAVGRSATESVPPSLRRWFVVHFVADMLFAVPLVLLPASTLRALGWTAVDPVAARLVGAALAGIGVESLLGRNASAEAFRGMLRLKCIWSGVAVVGLSISIFEGAPSFAWVLLIVFLAFAGLWNYYRRRMRWRAGRV